jgi:8-oxo-dGTP pyrophosphatase MutT (NUDIX family)
MSTRNVYCINCNKLNHTIKYCTEPIISYGIICVKFDDNLNVSVNCLEQYLVNKLIDMDEYNFTNLMNLSKIDYYKDKIKFLTIQRKYSFAYVELIRGKYDETNLQEILNLLHLMTPYEVNRILTSTFETLWDDLWKKTSKYKIFQKEYELSQNKFIKMMSNHNLIKVIEYNKLYDEPEWGFPKGRKDKNEKNLKCAIREFGEETGIDINKYFVFNRLNTVDELVIDTEQTKYKLVYYLAMACEDIELTIKNTDENYEIGDIKWLTFEEIITKIRPYFKEKITLIYKVYFLFINLLENSNNIKHISLDLI